MSHYKWTFRLLANKGTRKIVLIPLVILLLLSAYAIYQTELNPKPEVIEMTDGSGDIRLTKRSALLPFKLPKEVGQVRKLIGEDVKVVSYDVILGKDKNIKSGWVNIKADVNGVEKLIASYQQKYVLEQDGSEWTGKAGDFNLQIKYNEKEQRLQIEFDKE